MLDRAARPGQYALVPDDDDYTTFFDLLARPETWTEDERGLMDFSLRGQRELLRDSHPRDPKRRAELAKIVRQIEAAIERHDESRP